MRLCYRCGEMICEGERRERGWCRRLKKRFVLVVHSDGDEWTLSITFTVVVALPKKTKVVSSLPLLLLFDGG